MTGTIQKTIDNKNISIDCSDFLGDAKEIINQLSADECKYVAKNWEYLQCQIFDPIEKNEKYKYLHKKDIKLLKDFFYRILKKFW